GMTTVFLSETTTTRVQDASDMTPGTFAEVGARPCSPKVRRIAYSGLVPRSPYTTPTAPSASACRRVRRGLAEASFGMLVIDGFRARSAQRGLERLADDVLGAVAGRRRVAHQAGHLGRLVAERLQRDARLAHRIVRRHARAAAQSVARAEVGDPITQLDEDAFRGLLADARHARQCGDVAGLHEPREFVR